MDTDARHPGFISEKLAAIYRLLFKHFCLQPFFLKDWVSLLFAKSVSPEVPQWWAVKGEILTFGSPDPWKMHFQHTLTSKDILSMADKHHFPPWILWFSDEIHEISSPKSVHKSRWQTPQGCLFCGSYHFFCNQTWPGHSVMLSSDFSFLCMSKHCSISVICSYSNEFIFCTIHFSSTQLHEMLLLSWNNEVKQKPSISKQHLRLFDTFSLKTCSYFASLVPFNKNISMLVLLFCTRLFGHLFSMCYTFQTDDYKTARWNSLEPCFHLEIDTVFYSCIDHGFRYNSLLEFIKSYSRNYQKVYFAEFENV